MERSWGPSWDPPGPLEVSRPALEAQMVPKITKKGDPQRDPRPSDNKIHKIEAFYAFCFIILIISFVTFHHIHVNIIVKPIWSDLAISPSFFYIGFEANFKMCFFQIE